MKELSRLPWQAGGNLAQIPGFNVARMGVCIVYSLRQEPEQLALYDLPIDDHETTAETPQGNNSEKSGPKADTVMQLSFSFAWGVARFDSYRDRFGDEVKL